MKKNKKQSSSIWKNLGIGMFVLGGLVLGLNLIVPGGIGLTALWSQIFSLMVGLPLVGLSLAIIKKGITKIFKKISKKYWNWISRNEREYKKRQNKETRNLSFEDEDYYDEEREFENEGNYDEEISFEAEPYDDENYEAESYEDETYQEDQRQEYLRRKKQAYKEAKSNIQEQLKNKNNPTLDFSSYFSSSHNESDNDKSKKNI